VVSGSAAGFASCLGNWPPFFALIAQRPRLWYIFEREYFLIPGTRSGLRAPVLAVFGAIDGWFRVLWWRRREERKRNPRRRDGGGKRRQVGESGVYINVSRGRLANFKIRADRLRPDWVQICHEACL
jgi:hypothetical protein